MNLSPAALATLPPLDEGLEDKLIFLLGRSMEYGPIAKEMALPGWYARVEKRIKGELPAFIHFLLEEFELPEKLRDKSQRFPTMSYKNEGLMVEIAQGSPEQYIMHRIDNDGRGIFSPTAADIGDFESTIDMDDNGQTDEQPWAGSADQLYDQLAMCGGRSSQQRFVKACPSPRILLSQLRNLEKSHPYRVGYSKRMDGWPDKSRGAEYWVILPEQTTPLQPEDLDSELGDLF